MTASEGSSSDPTDVPPHTMKVGPRIDSTAWVAPGAQVMGDVTLKPHSSIWYNAVVRGDIREIVIGKNSNIQDGCILHVGNDYPCTVGDNCTIGHNVNLHGCTVGEGCLVGIGAIVLNGAVIGRGSVIAAGALVKEGQIVPPRSLIVGIPGKKIRGLDEEVFETHLRWAQKYRNLARAHQDSNR